MDFGIYLVLFKPVGKDGRVRGGNFLALEPSWAYIVNLLGYGQRKAATAEAKAFDNPDRLFLLEYLIFAHNAHIGSAISNGLGNIVIPEVKHLNREVFCWRHQVPASEDEMDARFFQQF